jgi:hypothetical protein
MHLKLRMQLADQQRVAVRVLGVVRVDVSRRPVHQEQLPVELQLLQVDHPLNLPDVPAVERVLRAPVVVLHVVRVIRPGLDHLADRPVLGPEVHRLHQVVHLERLRVFLALRRAGPVALLIRRGVL